jgi:hypothetical protein
MKSVDHEGIPNSAPIPPITSSVNTMPPSEWAKKPQASPARSPYKIFPDEAARAIPMKIATVNSFSE